MRSSTTWSPFTQFTSLKGPVPMAVEAPKVAGSTVSQTIEEKLSARNGRKAPNRLTFQDFLTGALTATPNVSSVKTSLVIRSSKSEPGVPFEMSEHLVAEKV